MRETESRKGVGKEREWIGSKCVRKVDKVKIWNKQSD